MNKKKKKEKLTMSKKLMLFLFANCTLIEIFTFFIILYSFPFAVECGTLPDMTPLNALISVGVTEAISFAIYSLKAWQENKKGGIVYDMAMQNQNNDEKGAEG